jgi:membrane protein YdbS with pleckstrin-like domain
MIDLVLSVFKPIFLPLLKLKFDPPLLPEGSALVRALKPSESWFTYRALTALFGLLGQVIGTGVLAVAAVAKLGGLGVAIAVLLVLVEALVVGFALVATRVDFELRHFLVGDRSLRVTEGALTHREATLSYANVQNLEVTQGPFERLFGFQNLTVTTAGADQVPGTENSHSVTLVGLSNAEEIRALILGMLHQRKDSGLGEHLTAHEALPLERLLEIRDAAKALERAAS